VRAFIVIGYFHAALFCLLGLACAVEALLEVFWKRAWMAGTPTILLVVAWMLIAGGVSIGISARVIAKAEGKEDAR
jgi:hypothetical protein